MQLCDVGLDYDTEPVTDSDGMSLTVPVCEGHTLHPTILRVAGRDLAVYLTKHLTYRAYSFTASAGEWSGFHRETLLLGVDYDTVLTTAVIDKEKTNELPDNIFTVGVKRLRYGEVCAS